MIKIDEIVKEILAAQGHRTTVVYHDNCSDGFTAAWVAWKALGPKVKLVPAYHSGGFDTNQLEGDHLLIADYSFNLGTLLELQRRFKHVLVLDHHQSAEADLAEFGSTVFDLKRSGAGITWDTLIGSPRSKLIDYVEDRDLWRRILVGSDEIACTIENTPRDLASWDKLCAQLETKDGFADAVKTGSAIVAFKNRTIDDLLKTSRMVSIGGYLVPAVNASPCFKSELGNKLAKGHPFGATWIQDRNGGFLYSLRSTNEGADCSVIAEKYGGGGHRNAAAFRSDKILD